MGFNILRGRVTSVDEGLATVEVEGQSILGVANGVMINEQVILVVRPQAVSLSLERDIRKPKWRHCQCNILEGSVTRVRKTGPTAEVSIDAGFPLNSEVNADLVDELDLVVGSRVFVQFRASEVSLLSA
jgi:molybdopterin-binding protein